MSTAPKYDSCSIEHSAGLCAPAVRMVVVEAGTGDVAGETWHNLHPVLAIESRNVTVFTRAHEPGGYLEPATLEEAESEGWRRDRGPTPEYDAIVMDEEHDISTARLVFRAINTAYRIVVTPWPPEEDEARLAEVIAELTAEAIKNEARSRTPAAV